jgi:hypothetical protein
MCICALASQRPRRGAVDAAQSLRFVETEERSFSIEKQNVVSITPQGSKGE